jgi:hypothetical protein
MKKKRAIEHVLAFAGHGAGRRKKEKRIAPLQRVRKVPIYPRLFIGFPTGLKPCAKATHIQTRNGIVAKLLPPR